MINLFRKKKDDVIDLVALRKRGIIKDKPADSQSSNTDSAAGFLGDFTGVASSESSQKPELDTEGFKNKLDDFEYKIDAFADRVYKLIQRIEVLEKKIERLEGRRGS
ncbi:hypothetical protein HYV49_05670 [Candidatus Pacearchaeota archaeon]|nr:hypothetical protein [Candidatus Pacearchaeota archaeon]